MIGILKLTSQLSFWLYFPVELTLINFLDAEPFAQKAGVEFQAIALACADLENQLVSSLGEL